MPRAPHLLEVRLPGGAPGFQLGAGIRGLDAGFLEHTHSPGPYFAASALLSLASVRLPLCLPALRPSARLCSGAGMKP